MDDFRTRVATVVAKDLFLAMTAEAQSLYFHLLLTAENDGEITRMWSTMKLLDCNTIAKEDLIDRGYIIDDEDAAVYRIADWDKLTGASAEGGHNG